MDNLDQSELSHQLWQRHIRSRTDNRSQGEPSESDRLIWKAAFRSGFSEGRKQNSSLGRQQISYDLEFIDDGRTIDIISIGAINLDGSTYYAVNHDCDFSKANDWVLENVLAPMGLDRTGFTHVDPHFLTKGSPLHKSCMAVRSKARIAREFLVFALGHDAPANHEMLSMEELSKLNPATKIELWGHYSAYDHVALMQLYGPMMAKPACLPMVTHDLKQECDYRDDFRLPDQGPGEHNALADAVWNMQGFRLLRGIMPKSIFEPVK